MCVYNCLGNPLDAAGHGKQQEADFEAGWLATEPERVIAAVQAPPRRRQRFDRAVMAVRKALDEGCKFFRA